jgi:hypothetical protein
VEPVDKLETKRDQQGNAKQNPRHRLGLGQILAERVTDIDDADQNQHPEGRQEPFAATRLFQGMIRPWNPRLI